MSSTDRASPGIVYARPMPFPFLTKSVVPGSRKFWAEWGDSAQRWYADAGMDLYPPMCSVRRAQY
eukprot:3941217-Rhodomonas_salina.8